MDEKPPGERLDDGHEARVHEAFDHLSSTLGDRAEGPARDALARVRLAAANRDAEAAREGLTAVQEDHGWLYEEMTRHPRVAALIDELALWGL
ncbi:MAG: hypothetical protein ABIT01_03420 [Thermoanaerobaculia bacterium]